MQVREKTGQTLTDPVTAAELKTYLGYTATDQDSYFADLITSARRWVENYTSLSAVSKIYEVFFEVGDDLNGWFTLPYAPVSSITSVHLDGDDVTYEEKGMTEVSIYPYWVPTFEGLNVEYIAGATDQIKVLKDAIYAICAATFKNKSSDLVVLPDVKKKLSTVAIISI
jgi:hypothetical protein